MRRWGYLVDRYVLHEYVVSGTTILRELVYDTSSGTKVLTHALYYGYDEAGSISHVTVKLFDTDSAGNSVVTASGTFYYVKNLQGDVTAIVNDEGAVLVQYKYDAWGSCYSYNYASGMTEIESYIAHNNPFRYRGYYYDGETGFYYLNSRYYDPEIGRFLNGDAYVSTGQGPTGYNMYVYCGNNPVNRVDSNGKMWKVVGRLIFSWGVACLIEYLKNFALPYSSADEAAMAFANSIYSSCDYIRHEYGTVIYSWTSFDGTITYDYAAPVSGGPHGVGYGNVKIPEGATKVATVHTHPNSNFFSGANGKPGDITNAIHRKLDSYVIGPNLILQKYSVSLGVVTQVGRANPVPLTIWQRAKLILQFIISWTNHLGTCDFGCETMIWPKQ